MAKKGLNVQGELDVKKFDELGLRYTVESIVFLSDHGRTMNDAIDFYGRADNIFYLVGAGLKEKTLENAKNTIQKLMDEGFCLEVIYCLCTIKARECGFFINERGLDTLDVLSKSENLLDNKTALDVIVRVMAQYQKSLDVQEKLT